ncbi:peptidoglycan/LPS O-acetylase OafA/YrhL [Rhizobium tibeticum]|uniref:acyltransferase family protein n=1 Tax=Rhizobium tibeticum TaxID=501024 RepID=UPI002788085D|nr:acyltransferase [Rhizobium tibeticum]MDP9813439.1 peptidoglycan/LPS O-acetylase OafA/YrhL [Rhizobium tibeticum]
MGNTRFAHIDAMRAIAVLLVVWTHSSEGFAGISGSQLFLDDLQNSVNFGRIGVVIFFAISGMLIPSSLRGDAASGKRSFLIRRFFRLFPAYWLSVVIYWSFLPGREVADLTANLTMLPWIFGREPLTGLYWTLETELYFYLACVLVFRSRLLHRVSAVASLAVFFSLAFVAISALHLIPESVPGPYKGLPLHLAIMFWGATFRKTWDEGRYRSWSFIGASGAVLLASMAILTYGIKSGDPKQIANGLAYLIGLGLFSLFATALKITFKPLAWGGKISYSVYLLHGVAISAILHILSPGLPLGVYLLAVGVAALAISWASFTAVEAVGIRWGATFSTRRQLAAAWLSNEKARQSEP